MLLQLLLCSSQSSYVSRFINQPAANTRLKMAIRNTIVLTDAATTPVNHSYYPVTQKDNTTLVWRDRTQAIAAGQNVLSVQQKSPVAGSSTYKVSWKLECPVLNVTAPTTGTGIQPAPSVAYKNIATIEFVMHERASQQERKDMLTQLRDLIDEAIVTSQVNDLDYIW